MFVCVISIGTLVYYRRHDHIASSLVFHCKDNPLKQKFILTTGVIEIDTCIEHVSCKSIGLHSHNNMYEYRCTLDEYTHTHTHIYTCTHTHTLKLYIHMYTGKKTSGTLPPLTPSGEHLSPKGIQPPNEIIDDQLLNKISHLLILSVHRSHSYARSEVHTDAFSYT